MDVNVALREVADSMGADWEFRGYDSTGFPWVGFCTTESTSVELLPMGFMESMGSMAHRNCWVLGQGISTRKESAAVVVLVVPPSDKTDGLLSCTSEFYYQLCT